METTNLSKIRRDKMLKTINEIKKKISDEETLTNLSMIENELTKKKYGLIWEEHEERVDKELETQIPTFEEIKEKEIISSPDNKFNFLLEGDNLHSLYLLEKTHKDKIKMIYIDPPYNTGNKDFTYDDHYIDSEDSYKHSKWLSFMKRRLELSKQLLSDDGVIFISIDNNEQAQLKLLCDDIFGENSFVTTIHVELSATQGMKVRAAKSGNIVKNAEYIHVYSKNGRKNIGIKPLLDPVKYDAHYNLYIVKRDDCFEEYNLSEKIPNDIIDKLKTLDLTDKNNKLSNNNISLAYEKCDEFKQWINNNSNNICRTHDSIDVDAKFKDSMIIGKIYLYNNGSRTYYISKDENNNISQRIMLSEKLEYADDLYKTYGPTRIRGDWWSGFYLDMGNVSKEGGVKFLNGKKPIRLIKQLIKYCTNEDDLILDFFAGSGTTAHAVVELNKEDIGNRRFIVCTNNENNICEEITYQRLQNIKNDLKFNLKYYRCTYIPRLNTEKENLHNNLLINIKNLIQLENGIEIDDKKIRVYLNEYELDDFSTNQEELNTCDKIYISSDILLTLEQEQIFENNNIEVYIIPEYYFEDEIMEVM